MPQLALNHDQRHAFAGELHGVGVAQLVWRKSAAGHRPRRPSCAARSGGGVGPLSPARRTGENAEQRSDGKPDAHLEPGPELGPSPGRPCRSRAAVRPCRDGPAPRRDHDQPAQPTAMRTLAGGAHDGDDLLHLGRVGGIPDALLRGGRPAWNPGIVAGDRRLPARSSSGSDMVPPRARGRARALRDDCASASVTQRRREQIPPDCPVCLNSIVSADAIRLRDRCRDSSL